MNSRACAECAEHQYTGGFGRSRIYRHRNACQGEHTSESLHHKGEQQSNPLDHLLSYGAPSGAHIQRSKLIPTGSINRDQTTNHDRRNICAHPPVRQ